MGRYIAFLAFKLPFSVMFFTHYTLAYFSELLYYVLRMQTENAFASNESFVVSVFVPFDICIFLKFILLNKILFKILLNKIMLGAFSLTLAM